MAKTRSEKAESRFILEMRKELKKVARERDALKKENNRLQSEIEELRSAMTEEKLPEKKKEKVACPECNMFKGFFQFVLRGTAYYKCENCGSKGRLN